MKQVIFSFFLILLFANSFAQSSVELKIHYSDSVNFHENKKLYFHDSVSAATYLNKKITDLKSRGFIAASNDKLSADSTTINSSIFVGNQYVFGNIVLDSIEKLFLEKFDFKINRFSNKIITENSFSNFAEKILKIYENNGFPLVKLNFENLTFDENKLNGKINITRNHFYKIDSLNAKGNLKIKNSVLYSLIDMKPNDIYNESKIKSIEQKLRNVPYLSLTKPVEVAISEENAKINLVLEKKKSNNFSAIIGFIPNHNIVGKLLLTGELDLLLYNSLKFGEKLRFNWQKLDESSQKMDMLVNIPYLLNLPVGIETSFNLNKKDTSYLNTSYNLYVNYHLSNKSSTSVFYKNKSSNVLTENFVSSQISNFNTRLFGFGIAFNTLDYIFNPSKGFLLNADLGVGNKNSFDEKNNSIKNTQIELESNFTHFFTIHNNLVFKIRNQSAFMKLYREQNYNFYENEAFKIGGLKTLRGFDEESIIATSYSIFTTEIRLLFEENSALYLFADGAFVEQNFEKEFVTDIPIGIGAGIDFETKAGIFTLNYAVGKQLGNPFLLKSAKIHFGFVSRF